MPSHQWRNLEYHPTKRVSKNDQTPILVALVMVLAFLAVVIA